MPDLPDAVESLKRIEAWVARDHPERMPFLRPAAELDKLVRLEAKLGNALPSDVHSLYAAYDGQPEGAPSLYLNQRWLPLDLAVVAWEDLCLRYGSSDELRLAKSANDRPPLKATAWSAGWLPLFGSPRGDHYCIDLRFQSSYCYGQIIWFLYDRPERAVVAPSISQFLRRVADGLDSGEWRLDAGYDGLSD
jgi:cell wall assembly regulator SMI1